MHLLQAKSDAAAAGIELANSAQRVTIRGNSIFNNAGIGIDLLGNGITPNDTGDADEGPNRLQNAP
ncbi:MAG: hypothetical protein AAFP86_15100, partial [Planctomycetota bacterium]